MFTKYPFPFDAKSVEDFFKAGDFTKPFFGTELPSFDTTALMEAQKKNMEALVEANKTAAAGYQELFGRQVALFEETMKQAQTRIAAFDTKDLTPEGAKAQAEVVKGAFEKALGNMKELAEQAQKSNTEAYNLVAARIKDQVEELKVVAEKNFSA